MDDLLSHESFRQLLAEKGIGPRAFYRSLDALEASEVMEVVCELGNKTLSLCRRGQISCSQGEAMLLDLIRCFADPITRSKRVIEIAAQLRGYEK